MDIHLTALGISFISLLIASLSLGWNIYRDVVLKPRVRAGFQVSNIVGPGVPTRTFLSLSAVNHGPGRVTCNMIHVRTAPLWRRLLRRVRHGVIIGDWTNPLSARLPRALEVGETATLLIPYDRDCFLSTGVTDVGILDSFGRSHWAPRRDLERARAQFRRDFPNVGQPAAPAA